MTVRFAYPNVKREDAYIGCGRYVSVSLEGSPPEGSLPAEPETPNLSKLHTALALLAPEFQQSDNLIYEIMDEPEEEYYGDSTDLAYLLCLISGVRDLQFQMPERSGDIWCTGTIDIIDGKMPFLNAVFAQSFTVKLEAFLSEANNDPLFIVPSANVLGYHKNLCANRGAKVSLLEALNNESQFNWDGAKTVLCVQGNELFDVIRLLFHDKPFPKEPKLLNKRRFCAILVFLFAVALVYSEWVGVTDFGLGSRTQALIEPPVKTTWTNESPYTTLDPSQKVTWAENRIEEEAYADAYGALEEVYRNTQDPVVRGRALYLKSNLLAQFLERPKRAIQGFKDYLDAYPEGPDSDSAHYILGMLYMEEDRLKPAISHFTCLFEHYPESPQKENARFVAQACARKLEERGTWVGYVWASKLGAILPNNIASLALGLISWLVLTLASLSWIALGFHKSGRQERHPVGRMVSSRHARHLVVFFVLMQFVAFFISQQQSTKMYQELVAALKANGIAVANK